MLDGLRVADVVKAVREGLGLTVAELATELGVTSAYVAQVEGGRCFPKVAWKQDYYWRLSKALFSEWGDPMPFYANLVALDLYERQPEVYLLLGHHFVSELKHELGHNVLARRPGRMEGEAAPHASARQFKLIKP